MIDIFYSDEKNLLSPEIKELMQEAADAGVEMELGEFIEASGNEHDSDVAEVSVTITGEEDIRSLNREFRGNDKVTDVLSFPQYNGTGEIADALSDYYEEGPACLIGDVVICYEQACRQAEEYGTGLKRELLYLFVHSLMHLFGYDHEDEEDKIIMRSKEEKLLSKIGVN